MAKSLDEWVKTDVARIRDKPLKWLSEEQFFRDPCRPVFSDADYFFSPADGIIVYQQEVQPDECVIDIKGKSYSLQHAMRDETFDKSCLAIGIFMTMYDCHINRIPYSGLLSFRHLEPISTLNLPMLETERSLVEELRINHQHSSYLHNNQRVINRVCVPDLQSSYYILQIADYDIDCIVPFDVGQNQPRAQNERFSQIRFGSQVDLIVPLDQGYEFRTIQEIGTHVEAGLDPLIQIIRNA